MKETEDFNVEELQNIEKHSQQVVDKFNSIYRESREENPELWEILDESQIEESMKEVLSSEDWKDIAALDMFEDEDDVYASFSEIVLFDYVDRFLLGIREIENINQIALHVKDYNNAMVPDEDLSRVIYMIQRKLEI